MKKDDDPCFSLPNLLCNEDDYAWDSEDEKNQMNLISPPLHLPQPDDDDDEYVQMLIEKEANFQSDTAPLISDDFKFARLEAFNVIFDAKSALGLHIRTTYLSLTYFDQFFSRKSIESGKQWASRLLAVACFSLAAKVEEGKNELNSYKEYNDPYQFKSIMINKMEVLVLNTLQWKMGSTTPYDYLHYFIAKFCGEARPPNVDHLVTRAIELISSVLKVINLVDHPPSVIAAAAVLAAIDIRLTKTALEVKINLLPYNVAVDSDHVFSCYNMLVELIEIENLTPPRPFDSDDILSNHSIPGYIFPESRGVVTKRTLKFDADSERKSPPKKPRGP